MTLYLWKRVYWIKAKIYCGDTIKTSGLFGGWVSLLWQQNTANLYTLVDLINKSNEQQDELIAIIADILTIAKAKDKKEAESIYKKVMAKITQTVKDGETLAKVVGYATTVYELAKPIIENLKV